MNETIVDKSKAISAVRSSASSVFFLSSDLMNDRDIALEVVRNHPYLFRYLGSAMQGDPQVVLTCLENDPTQIKKMDLGQDFWREVLSHLKFGTKTSESSHVEGSECDHSEQNWREKIANRSQNESKSSNFPGKI